MLLEGMRSILVKTGRLGSRAEMLLKALPPSITAIAVMPTTTTCAPPETSILQQAISQTGHQYNT